MGLGRVKARGCGRAAAGQESEIWGHGHTIELLDAHAVIIRQDEVLSVHPLVEGRHNG